MVKEMVMSKKMAMKATQLPSLVMEWNCTYTIQGGDS
jgi:hypothetical protein